MVLPKIGIVLLNYNGYKDTIECIRSLNNINYKNHVIIIVDNASTDNSFEILEKNINKNCFLIQSEKNNGFANGNNIGIKKALSMNCDYVILLNNDTLVHKDFINEMIKCYSLYENVGLVSSKMLFYPESKKVWFGGGSFNDKKFIVTHQYYENEDNYEDSIREISFATACCLMISRNVIENVGLLPEEYFMYFEDVDYCYNVILNGYKIIYNPNAKIYHKANSSTKKEKNGFLIKYELRNRFICIEKYKNHMDAKKYKIIKFFYYASYFKQIIKSIIKLDRDNLISAREGLREAKQYIAYEKR
jgi:GT2 family glycosyltransferase